MTESLEATSEKQSDFKADFLEGLSGSRKQLSPKYLYDALGSHLFSKICALDEYYLTRSEIGILRENARDIASRIGAGTLLIELGSGASAKTRVLLSALDRPAAYLPVDICPSSLTEITEELQAEFSGLEVIPVHADFLGDFDVPGTFAERSRTVFFPGSTIGNLDPLEATRLLSRMRKLVGRSGAILVGVDLLKDPAIIKRAYNDSAGVTAAFNLNLLARANRELGADFDLSRFGHEARFNPILNRVEMHLVSLLDQRTQVGGVPFDFAKGESIHTESSYKYSPEGFVGIAEAALLKPEAFWTDERRYFGVFLLRHLESEVGESRERNFSF